ncbi:MAG: hypothetical protein ACK4WD_12395 [Flavobacteriales bacterium]
MEILTQSPSWFILLCLLAGTIYAGALYFRDKFNRTYGTPLASLLGAIRFVAVSLLAFFLLKPLIKSTNKEVEKPIVVIAQDNSESLSVVADSSYYKSTYLDNLRALKEALGEEYDVRTFSFGDKFEEGIDSVNFKAPLTDYSNLFNELTNRFSGRNLGAIIFASDGLYNKGSNPSYSYKKLNAPVYTVALGDTTVHKDVLISEVAANRLAYLNNQFPIQITVEGRKAAGETVQVTVSNKGNVVYSETVTFSNERGFKTINLLQEAKTVGLQRYTISVSTVKNEITIANNRKDVFIEVLDSRQKVLVLASTPHPDIQALSESIANNEAYAVEAKLVKDFKANINDYNLIIFHQLPAVGGIGLNYVSNALDKNIPALFVWGANTDFRAFNDLSVGYSLNNYRNSNTEVGGSVAEAFSIFQLSPNTVEMIRNVPPLTVPFGEQSSSQGAITFVRQQVGQIATDKPLISFNKKGENKIGLIAGEGIWRWRINSFRQYENHDAFNEMVTKMVQYLAVKDDKSLFRVNAKNDFPENEPIIFDAELYNASYEAITDKEIKIVIKNEDGKEFPYTFSPLGGRYKLNAGNLPVGNYKYVATVVSEGQNLTESGEFSVSALQVELTNTVADHKLLYQFAKDNGGEMVSPREVSKLADLIKAREDIASISYENKELNDLINFRWILFLLIGLLSLEWLLRKRAGTY